MIELPNNQIARNLPEQVGFNTKKIQEIIDFLNESGMKDLVVNLEADSGALTNEQYAVLELSPSYIVLNGRVFYKALEDGTNIDFFDLSAPSISAGVSSQTVKRIRIVEATKNYSTTDVVLSSYTKDALDTALSAKADLSGATFTGEIKAPTIIQQNPNSSVDISRWNSTDANLTPDPIYTKMFVENGLDCHIVVCLALKNESGSSVTISGRVAYTNANYVSTLTDFLPFAEKIIDLNGKKLSEVPTTNATIRIAKGTAIINKTTVRPTVYDCTAQLIHTETSSQSSFQIEIYGVPSVTLNDNDSLYLMFEMNLTL